MVFCEKRCHITISKINALGTECCSNLALLRFFEHPLMRIFSANTMVILSLKKKKKEMRTDEIL
jgi:hypothetical protein